MDKLRHDNESVPCWCNSYKICSGGDQWANENWFVDWKLKNWDFWREYLKLSTKNIGIVIKNLTKKYGDYIAVDNISIEVKLPHVPEANFI